MRHRLFPSTYCSIFALSLLVLVGCGGGSNRATGDGGDSAVNSEAGANDGSTSHGEDADTSPRYCGAGNRVECHPVTGEGCTQDQLCSFGSMDNTFGFYCFARLQGVSVVGEGQACDIVAGPVCDTGLGCHNSLCERLCCSNTDCEVGETCTKRPTEWEGDVGTLRACHD
jgi:hypothetical protein